MCRQGCTMHTAVCPSGVEHAAVCAACHAISFSLAGPWGVEALASYMVAKDNGKMLFVVDVVGVQMEEHFCAVHCWNTGTDDALHVG